MAWSTPTDFLSEANLANQTAYTFPASGSLTLTSGRLYYIFVRANHASSVPDLSTAGTLVGSSDQGAISPTFLAQAASFMSAVPGRIGAWKYIPPANRTTVTFTVDEQALGNLACCFMHIVEVASGFDATTQENVTTVNAAENPNPSEIAVNHASAPESDALGILFVSHADNTGAFSTPSGWTLLVETLGSGGTSDSGSVAGYYKDPDAQNVTAGATGGTTNDYAGIHIEVNAETASNDRRAVVTWAEMEVPTAPRRAVVTWAEMEAPDAPRRAVVTWAEMEAPDAPRRAVVTWAEMEVADAPRRAVVTWAELETPDAPTDRRARVTWAEMEVPDAPRRALVTWAEMEAPDAPRRAVVTWAEIEVPTAPRRAVVTWAEIEVPDSPVGDRRARITWAEFEVPDTPAQAAGRRRARAFEDEWNARRRALITWAVFEVPDPPATVGTPLELPTFAVRESRMADPAPPTGPIPAAPPPPDLRRRVLITWAEFEVPDQDDRARIVLLRTRLDRLEEESFAISLLLGD